MKKFLFLVAIVFALPFICFGEEPTVKMTSALDVNAEFYLALEAASDQTVVKIDFGDGVWQEFTIGTQIRYIYHPIGVSKVVVLSGSGLVRLDCMSNKITNIDVSNYPLLNNLICDYNLLSELDVTNVVALTNLSAVGNQLRSIDVSKNIALTVLSLGTNKLAAIDVSKNTALIRLYFSANNVTSLDISNNTELEYLVFMFNNISSLDLSHNHKITWFSCQGNCFTFATLPKLGTTGYTLYAPQRNVFIDKNTPLGGEVDLSDQYLIGGDITQYAWYIVPNKLLMEGEDYSISNGKTKFLKSQPDSVYCKMTNASYPALSGASYSLHTTYTKIELATGLDDMDVEGSKIKSNKGQLSISVTQPSYAVVYDINGREVESFDLVAGENLFSLDSKGLFIVELTNSSGSERQKVLLE